jgi:hypothetical protein
VSQRRLDKTFSKNRIATMKPDKLRRLLFYLFGLLDVILFVRFPPKDLAQFASVVSHEPLSGALLDIMRLFFFVSLLISAAGLFGMKKWALIISYVQFPFRIVFVLLSFGFIHYLSSVFHEPSFNQPLIYVAIILECLRLICSVWLHRSPTPR